MKQKSTIKMDLEKLSEELNNKKVEAVLEKESNLYRILGPKFIGRLVGRTREKCGTLQYKVVALTILTAEYITYQIPTDDIIFIKEIFM
ncbi:MAG TPA: hypothetical protein VD908_07025 [Cytophagales bacterium]|nr:hypothetical protein [Cytophagales bacterium]